MTRMSSTLKQKLKTKTATIGSWISLASDEACEIMCQGAFEWLAIDMEHTAISVNQMQRMIRIIELSGITPIVRVGANDPLLIKRALDAGAHGIIAPMVCSRKDAEDAVSAAHFPPRGTRGVGLHRAQGYGMAFDAYARFEKEDLVVIAQIEHKDGVAALPDIMATPGLDGFFIGPYDLSASFGKPGAFDDKDVKAALEKVDDAVRNGPIAGGIHIVHPDPEALKLRQSAGYSLIAFGIDFIFLAESVQAAGRLIK